MNFDKYIKNKKKKYKKLEIKIKKQLLQISF